MAVVKQGNDNDVIIKLNTLKKIVVVKEDFPKKTTSNLMKMKISLKNSRNVMTWTNGASQMNS